MEWKAGNAIVSNACAPTQIDKAEVLKAGKFCEARICDFDTTLDVQVYQRPQRRNVGKGRVVDITVREEQ